MVPTNAFPPTIRLTLQMTRGSAHPVMFAVNCTLPPITTAVAVPVMPMSKMDRGPGEVAHPDGVVTATGPGSGARGDLDRERATAGG